MAILCDDIPSEVNAHSYLRDPTTDCGMWFSSRDLFTAEIDLRRGAQTLRSKNNRAVDGIIE